MDDYECIFFPILIRREHYSIKSNGEYFNYRHYKHEIREDCLKRCVYCDIREEECGGDGEMEVEHFRPVKRFANLKNDPLNLVYSCGSCNRFKSDYWPEIDGNIEKTYTDEGDGFIDPFLYNRSEYFMVLENGEIIGLMPPAKFMINLLALNRENRKINREVRYKRKEFLRKFNDMTYSFSEDMDQVPEDQKENVMNIQKKLIELLNEYEDYLKY